jgi:hypothetical protein
MRVKKIYWVFIATILVSMSSVVRASVWDYVPGVGGGTKAPPAEQPQAATAVKDEESEDVTPVAPAAPAAPQTVTEVTSVEPAAPQTVTDVTPATQSEAATAEEHKDDDADETEAEDK